MHKEGSCICIHPAVQVNIVQRDVKGLLPRKHILCGAQLEGNGLALSACDVREVHRAVCLHGYYARRLAAVGQADGAGADGAYVVYCDGHGELLLAAHCAGVNRAFGYEQLRLFHLLFGHVVGVGRVFAVGYGHIHGEGLLLLLPQHVEVIGFQRHGI